VNGDLLLIIDMQNVANCSVWFGAVTRQIDVYERISCGEIAVRGRSTCGNPEVNCKV
jgi:hypothetical protein